MKTTIAVLLGTVRTGRESVKAARYVAEFGKKFDDVEIVMVDPQLLRLSDEGEVVKDPEYSGITARADAFIIVTPEYNHSFPGTLKRMLDSEYTNYKHKPVGLVGVSNGNWGGVRVCEALLPVCHRLGLINILPEVYFPKIQDIFDDTATIKPEFEQRYEKSVGAMFDELLWFTQKLKDKEDSNESDLE